MKTFRFTIMSVCYVDAETQAEAEAIFERDHCHCDVEHHCVQEVDPQTFNPLHQE